MSSRRGGGDSDPAGGADLMGRCGRQRRCRGGWVAGAPARSAFLFEPGLVGRASIQAALFARVEVWACWLIKAKAAERG